MLFNSIEFLIFLPIVFILYWFVCGRSLRLQNLLVVVASYVFYGWWNWRFLILIAFTSICSWGSGIFIERHRQGDDNVQVVKRRSLAKLFLWSNIVLNLLILGFFKYFNFFVESFVDAFALCGVTLHATTLKIILPVGISFYTFQALSYSIDVYKGKISATKDVVAFFAYVSFFPQLVAGPIERATNLLPLMLAPRKFDYSEAVDGCRQMLWGFFKKMVIADNCAVYVDRVWPNYMNESGSTLLIAAILFTFQIYGDFSGYSDIAIGCSKLFGIKLKRNFNVPYFSRNIAEFWRRWHISLTTWFRDYVYIPLGGSRTSKAKIVRNTFIIFIVSGFWHGANWTFVTWGAYNALLFLPLILLGRNRRYTGTVAEGKLLPSVKELMHMSVTFMLVVVGWIIFRSDSVCQAMDICKHIVNPSLFSAPRLIAKASTIQLSFSLPFMLFLEWLARFSSPQDVMKSIRSMRFRWAFYFVMFLLILILRYQGNVQFIYFQF